MKFKIRAAVYDDYKAIAQIHIYSWQKAYRGLVPNEHLDNLSLQKGELGWQRRLGEELNKVTLVAVDDNDKVLGYCCGGDTPCGGDNRCDGDNRSEPKEYLGELQAIYIHPDYWRMGIGKMLFEEFKKRLQLLVSCQA